MIIQLLFFFFLLLFLFEAIVVLSFLKIVYALEQYDRTIRREFYHRVAQIPQDVV